MKGTSLISIYSFFMKWRGEIEAKTPFLRPKKTEKNKLEKVFCFLFPPPLSAHLHPFPRGEITPLLLQGKNKSPLFPLHISAKEKRAFFLGSQTEKRKTIPPSRIFLWVYEYSGSFSLGRAIPRKEGIFALSLFLPFLSSRRRRQKGINIIYASGPQGNKNKSSQVAPAFVEETTSALILLFHLLLQSCKERKQEHIISFLDLPPYSPHAKKVGETPSCVSSSQAGIYREGRGRRKRQRPPFPPPMFGLAKLPLFVLGRGNPTLLFREKNHEIISPIVIKLALFHFRFKIHFTKKILLGEK